MRTTEKNKEYCARFYAKNRERENEKHKVWYNNKAEYLRALRFSRKEQVLNHYGKFCNCCEEQNPLFLSIDHKNNDGHKERKGRGGSSDQIIRNIIKANFPNTYQILCYNCNMGKARNSGTCPHEIELN